MFFLFFNIFPENLGSRIGYFQLYLSPKLAIFTKLILYSEKPADPLLHEALPDAGSTGAMSWWSCAVDAELSLQRAPPAFSRSEWALILTLASILE